MYETLKDTYNDKYEYILQLHWIKIYLQVLNLLTDLVNFEIQNYDTNKT